MARAPFQVLVIPFRKEEDDKYQYFIFQRPDSNNYGPYWQGIAGGGEDKETPTQAAKRESMEESRLILNSKIIKLDSLAYIPSPVAAGFLWALFFWYADRNC
jgi:dihydroneopterin triphosphate diphosphatase